jgi:peptidyl-prolyl cis-trans isomerase SurA
MSMPTSARTRARRGALSLLLAALLISTLGATPRTARAEIVDRIIATVNGEVITLSDFYTTVRIFIQMNGVPPQAVATVDGRRTLAARVMTELINRTMIDQQAEQHELQVERSAVEGFITRMAGENNLSVEALREQLGYANIDYDDFYEYVRYELTKLRVVRVMVTAGVSVSDAEVDAVLDERYPEGVTELRYDVSQILIARDRNGTDEDAAAARALAESLREQLVAGGDFAALATEHSNDPSRRNGGNMGEFRRGQLPPDFEREVLSLAEGELSPVFESRFGYHIVRLERRWEEPSIDVEAVREQIYGELQEEKSNREITRYMAQLHDDAIVQILFDPTNLY